VKRLIETQGPAAARYNFGDAIVTDVLLKGISPNLGKTTVTHDCGCGGTCGCGGHGHVHPAHTNDREARQAARRERLADAVRAGVADAKLKVEQAARLRAFLQSGRRAR
jgi:hypothetical protein